MQDEPLPSAAEVALMQRGAEILSGRPPLFDDAATRSGSFGLVGGSSVQRIEVRDGAAVEQARGRRWVARHTMVVTVSSLVLCLLVGCLLLADVGRPAQMEGFLSGGAAREDALLSGAMQKKSAAAGRLAKLAQTWPSDHAPPIPGNARAATVEESRKQTTVEPQLAAKPDLAKPTLKVVEAKPLQSLAKNTAVATAKIVKPKPAVKFVKSEAPAPKAAVVKPAAAPPRPTVPTQAKVAPPMHKPVQQGPPQQEYVQQPYQQMPYPYAQQPAQYQQYAPQYVQQGYQYPAQQLHAAPAYQQPMQYPQEYQQAPPQFAQQQPGYAPQNTLYQAPQPAYGYPQQAPQAYSPQYAYNGYPQPPQYAMPQQPQQEQQMAQALPQQRQVVQQQQQVVQQQPAQAQQPVQAQQQQPAAPAAVLQAAPKQVLSLKPALPKVETIKQLQEQVQQQAMPQMTAQLPAASQKLSLQQRLVASLPPSVQKEAAVAQPTGPSPMLVDGSAADTASLQQQAGQKVILLMSALCPWP